MVKLTSFIALVAWDQFYHVVARDTPASVVRKPIIIDTDIMTDVDDVGALAVANVLHNCGYADLRGVVINTHSRYGALAASVVNTYFGNGDVPIAAIRPLTNDTFLDTYEYSRGEYVSKLAHHFPRRVSSADELPTPLDLYRSVLSAAANGSVTVISVGFLTNLATLVSADRGLVASRVAELVVMGGRYPEGGWEYNFAGGSAPASASASAPGDQGRSARAVLAHWPSHVPLTFSGVELGARIFSGCGGSCTTRTHPRPSETPDATGGDDSPVAAAYEWYAGRCCRRATARESWDPLTVLYGVLGPAAGVEFGNRDGRNDVPAGRGGANRWVDDPAVRNQHWLRLQDAISEAAVAALLERLYAFDPRSSDCRDVLWPHDGGGLRPDDGGGLRPDDGGAFRSDDGGAFRPDDGGGLRPDDGGVLRADSGDTLRSDNGDALAAGETDGGMAGRPPPPPWRHELR